MTDVRTAERNGFLYARILVEVDATKELIRKIDIRLPNGKQREQKIDYEGEPKYCLNCKKLGHAALECKGQDRFNVRGRGRSKARRRGGGRDKSRGASMLENIRPRVDEVVPKEMPKEKRAEVREEAEVVEGSKERRTERNEQLCVGDVLEETVGVATEVPSVEVAEMTQELCENEGKKDVAAEREEDFWKATSKRIVASLHKDVKASLVAALKGKRRRAVKFMEIDSSQPCSITEVGDLERSAMEKTHDRFLSRLLMFKTPPSLQIEICEDLNQGKLITLETTDVDSDENDSEDSADGKIAASETDLETEEETVAEEKEITKTIETRSSSRVVSDTKKMEEGQCSTEWTTVGRGGRSSRGGRRGRGGRGTHNR